MTIDAKDMRAMVDDYGRDLPSWTRWGNSKLVRIGGPIVQVIEFDRLLSDAYRAYNWIHILVAPDPVSGVGMVRAATAADEKGLEVWVRARSHARDQSKMLEAILGQFRPAVYEPLTIAASVDAIEAVWNKPPDTYKLYALARLQAWRGNDAAARLWCQRHRELVERSGQTTAELEPWDRYRIQQTAELENWLDAGEAKARLQTVCDAEVAAWFRKLPGLTRTAA